MRLVFWQNIISPHQGGFMKALAERGHDVAVVAAAPMSGERERLGWKPPDISPAMVVLAPSVAELLRLIENSPTETIHCLAGARLFPMGRQVIHACRKHRRRMGIISESPDPRGLYGWGRWIKYAIEAWTRGRNFDFVLGMGETGVAWFRSCGYPESRVFPFAYVSEFGPSLRPDISHYHRTRFLFVGQLIPRKGVDILLRAIANVQGAELVVVGDGPAITNLVELARQYSIDDRLTWAGKLERDAISTKLAEADVLVLPSRFDGWGAVVNEALSLGTPVICSSAAGASDVLQHEFLGTVVPTEDVTALENALEQWVAKGRRTAEQRSQIRFWAMCLSGKAIAEYAEKVFSSVYDGGGRPFPPWRTQVKTE